MDTSIFITDTNMIMDDTDSETSSTSTVEELKNNKNENNKPDSNIKNKLASKFPKPIKSHGFHNKEQNQEVDDGFELSLLRLLHILFSSDGVINFAYLTKHMDMNKKESRDLEEFFIDNPGVMDDSDFYSTEAGIAIRKTWYNFLSGREFFTYVKNSHQIAPDISNFLAFVKQFFPLVDFIGNYNDQEKLDIIYSTFSVADYNFKAVYSTYSRVDNELVHKGFVQNIMVNGTELFVFESTNIKKINNLNKIYWTKTELRYY